MTLMQHAWPSLTLPSFSFQEWRLGFLHLALKIEWRSPPGSGEARLTLLQGRAQEDDFPCPPETPDQAIEREP